VDWNVRYKELVKFNQQHGNCDVPVINKHNKQLGTWVHTQRTVFRKGTLPKERIDMLEAIGFKWHIGTGNDHQNIASETPTTQPKTHPQAARHEQLWLKKYNQLLEYKQQNGHCNVSQTDKDNKQLGKWVSTQRQYYENKTLSKERISKLEDIDFAWKVKTKSNEESWNDMYKELVELKKKKGHCNVSRGDKGNKQLVYWIDTQRRTHKQGTLSKARVDMLEDIGFRWHIGKGNGCRKIKNTSSCPALPPLDQGAEETIDKEGNSGIAVAV
jgi:hypothetical protein